MYDYAYPKGIKPAKREFAELGVTTKAVRKSSAAYKSAHGHPCEQLATIALPPTREYMTAPQTDRDQARNDILAQIGAAVLSANMHGGGSAPGRVDLSQLIFGASRQDRPEINLTVPQRFREPADCHDAEREPRESPRGSPRASEAEQSPRESERDSFTAPERKFDMPGGSAAPPVELEDNDQDVALLADIAAQDLNMRNSLAERAARAATFTKNKAKGKAKSKGKAKAKGKAKKVKGKGKGKEKESVDAAPKKKHAAAAVAVDVAPKKKPAAAAVAVDAAPKNTILKRPAAAAAVALKPVAKWAPEDSAVSRNTYNCRFYNRMEKYCQGEQIEGNRRKQMLKDIVQEAGALWDAHAA